MLPKEGMVVHLGGRDGCAFERAALAVGLGNPRENLGRAPSMAGYLETLKERKERDILYMKGNVVIVISGQGGQSY